MKSVCLLIKPASSLCDLRCKYCFYSDVAANREIKSYGIMSEETVECLIRKAFTFAGPDQTVSFAFQGGEPTLAGLLFFKFFTETATRLNENNVRISYSIQTNGMNIDEEWAVFLHEHRFLVGISIDGNIETHDSHRIDLMGKGTWNRAVKAFKLLQKYQVATNILCVVSNLCSRNPQKVYAALKKLGASHVQFIPCLDPLDEERGCHGYSLKPERYGKFLCALFDVWYQDWAKGNYVSIRLFDDLVYLFMGLPGSTCATNGQCGDYFVVEGDGGLYPCDFYVLDEWRLGSVHDGITFSQLADSELARKFKERSQSKPQECATCQWRQYCHGGCPRDWYSLRGEHHNYYCQSFKMLFSHAAPRLQEIALVEMNARKHSF